MDPMNHSKHITNNNLSQLECSETEGSIVRWAMLVCCRLVQLLAYSTRSASLETSLTDAVGQLQHVVLR
jgi:hypothetical protein